METRSNLSLALSILLCLVASAALLCLVDDAVSAQSLTRYVATSGTDVGNCSDPNNPCRSVQYAVDTAYEGDVIKVATGVYTGVHGRPAPPFNYDGPSVVTQVLYINKTVTVRGGYPASSFFTNPDRIAHPTTLDAQGQGRVIFVTGNVSPTLEGLRITGGDASGLGGSWGYLDVGGGICAATEIVHEGLTIRDSEITGNSAISGGGIYFGLTGAITLTGNTISGNSSTGYEDPYLQGGGGVMLNGSEIFPSRALVVGNAFISNSSQEFGGGLWVQEHDSTIDSNTFSGNSSPAVFVPFSEYTTMAISNNRFADNPGIAVQVNGKRITIVGNVFSGNGAGVACSSCDDLEVLDNRFTGNSGHAIALTQTHNSLIGGNVMMNNTAEDGAGIRIDWLSGYYYGEPIMVEENRIIGNVATSAGGTGGLLVDRNSNVTLRNNLIAKNVSGACAIRVQDSTARLLHTTVAQNLSPYGICTNGATLTNTILVSHPVGILATGGTVTLEATLWGTGTWANESDWLGVLLTGTVNLWEDPAFVNPEDGDYHIKPNSAAVDSGIEADVEKDMDCHYRPYGLAPDLGADEVVYATVLPDIATTLVLTDSQGSATVIQVAPGAVTETITLVFTPQETTTVPLDYHFAGHAFDLEAYRDGELLPNLIFSEPVTITIHYSEADVAGLGEGALLLEYWKRSTWEDAACGPYDRHPAENWLAVPICHLSRFALFWEAPYHICLPVVLRNAW